MMQKEKVVWSKSVALSNWEWKILPYKQWSFCMGGLPRDLVFPTLENVKRDADKLTVDHCKKRLAVVIASDINISRCGVRPCLKLSV